jgi:hypothetical protein
MGRGPAQHDHELFGPEQVPALRAAVEELAWLLDRGYAETSALKLVGDRHQLRRRQRLAVLRCTCTDAQRRERTRRRLSPAQVAGRPLAIDGFNVVIAIEAALAGGVLLIGRDGVLRDMSSVHGSYRRTAHTLAASEAIGEQIAALAPASVLWLFDRPVSNSGRLRAALAELAQARGWSWTIELDYDPDRRLASFAGVVASGDGWILDQAAASFDLAAAVVRARCPEAWILELGLAGAGAAR